MPVVVNRVSLCAVWPLWGLCPGREEGALSYSFYLSAKQAWSMGLHPPSLQHLVGREMNAVSAQLAGGARKVSSVPPLAFSSAWEEAERCGCVVMFSRVG